MNIKNIKLTQDQRHCKNQIIDLAITYLVAKKELTKNKSTKITAEDLQQLEIESQKIPEKIRIPKLWQEFYPNAKYQIISKENYLVFIA